MRLLFGSLIFYFYICIVNQLNIKIMYSIKRECYTENTFNGHTDNPYWLIRFDAYVIGLKDNGTFWSIINGVNIKQPHIIDRLNKIIKECNLSITLVL